MYRCELHSEEIFAVQKTEMINLKSQLLICILIIYNYEKRESRVGYHST